MEGPSQEWHAVKTIKKRPQLQVRVQDHSKPNRCYAHTSLQDYIRYILCGDIPNPLWLAIKRQSYIEHIILLDTIIGPCMTSAQLPFLKKYLEEHNVKAMFKSTEAHSPWKHLLCYHNDHYEGIPEPKANAHIHPELFSELQKMMLTQIQLQQNLYPTLQNHPDWFCIDQDNILQQNSQCKQMANKEDFNYVNNIVNNQYQQQISKSKAAPPGQQSESNDQIFVPSGQQSESRSSDDLILCVDCEMVTTQDGFELGRTTICNYAGHVVFDEFFKPKKPIQNYNTQWSGLTQEILDPIQNTIQNTLYPALHRLLSPHTILVGHSLENDLNAMKVVHKRVIDTSVLFMKKNGVKIKLKHLAERHLRIKIQQNNHDSKEDCTSTMKLVRYYLVQRQRQLTYPLLQDLIQAHKGVLLIGKQLSQVTINIMINDVQFKLHNKQISQVCNGAHFEEVSTENTEETFKKISKYLCGNVKKPQLILAHFKANFEKKQSSIQIHSQIDLPQNINKQIQHPKDINQLCLDNEKWRQFYLQLDRHMQQLHQISPKGTLIVLNLQQLNKMVKQRPFCLFIVKN